MFRNNNNSNKKKKNGKKNIFCFHGSQFLGNCMFCNKI